MRVLLLLLSVMRLDTLAQPLFPGAQRLEAPYGVCTHITRPGFDYEIRDRELAVIHEAGIRWVRSDLDFHNAFRSPDDFNPSLFDNVLASTETHGTHLLGILTQLGRRPWDDRDYGRYLEQLARRYDGRITHWEMLNEVNLFRDTDSLCRRYIGSLQLAYETLKRINPANTVLTSGFAELPEPFVSDFSAMGGWRYCDVFNFHSYFAPEGLIPCFERLHGYMQRDGWQRPVWLTECGMHTARQENESSAFFTDLLPAALSRIGIQSDRVAVGILRDRAEGYSVLSDDEADILLRPFFRRVVTCPPSRLASLSVSKVPVVVATREEYFPADHFPALVDYVRRGGTIVLAGGMPFYYDATTPDGTYFHRKTLGTSLYPRLHISEATQRRDPVTGITLTETPPLSGRTDENTSAYEWKPTAASPARYMGDANLAVGDSLIPLVVAGTEHLRHPIAGIYRLNSDLHGNIIFQTRMYAPVSTDREAEQARRLPRTFLIAFAYGACKVFWYNLRSREDNPYYSEDCFGLLHRDFAEKPSMQAYRTLVSMCPEGSTRPELTVSDGLYRAVWHQPDGTEVTALWSPDERQRVRIAGLRRLDILDYTGKPVPRGGSRITVGAGVVYCLRRR